MPILPSEPEIFPEGLLDPEGGVDDAPWWAIYTLARREKDLMRRLRRMEIPFYCPLIAKRNRSPGGRTRVSHVPLFSGYVFLHGGQEERYQALTTNCISQCLPVADAQRLVTDLRQIRRLIAADVPLTPESQLMPGTRVRIRSGVLLGLEGVVLKRRGEDRLLVAVEFLQKGASVLLEDFDVERIE